MCVDFLYTVVLRLPSFLGVNNMSKKGMDPSSLHSSLVNCMLGSMLFRCSRNLSFSDDLMIVKVSSTNLFHRYGGCGDELMAFTSNPSMYKFATEGTYWRAHCSPYLLFKVPALEGKICAF